MRDAPVNDLNEDELYDGGSTAFQERPMLPPVMRTPAPTPPIAADPVIHLAQVAMPHDAGRWVIESWCSARGAVAFDPRIATCARCLRALHEEVNQ